MSDVFEHVTVLIKELVVLNRGEYTPALETPTLREVEELKSRRKKLRQELVHALFLQKRNKF
jgi:hypothetical protein